MSRLEFDARTHTYRLDGVVIPSVTQVLRGMDDWSRVDPEVMRNAAERGTQAHKLTELYDLGRLHDWDEYDYPLGWPYLEAWRAFRSHSGFNVTTIEERVWHPRLRFAGTLDRRGWLNGVPVVLDIKTGENQMPSWGPQTAAYSACLVHRLGLEDAPERVTVRLGLNGKYKLDVHRNPGDWLAFLNRLRDYSNAGQTGEVLLAAG